MVSFYANRDYIAQNLCVNRFDRLSVCRGSCMLEKKLEENDRKELQFPDLKVVEFVLTAPSVSGYDYKPVALCALLNNWHIKRTEHFIVAAYLHKILKPPISC